MIDFTFLARQSRQIRSHPSRNHISVEPRQTFGILCNVLWSNREIKAKSSVELNIDQAWSDNAAFEVNNIIWCCSVFVENFLAIEDSAASLGDPQVFLDNSIVFDKPAVSKLDDAAARRGWNVARDCGRHPQT